MTDDTADGLALWVMAIIALLALAEIWDRFGSIAVLIVMVIMLLPAQRLITWLEDSRRLRLDEERRANPNPKDDPS